MTLARSFILLGTAAALAIGGCSSAEPADESATADAISSPPKRDFAAHPAVFAVPSADEVYAVSDVHGQYDIFLRLLAANHLIAKAEADPAKVKWTGGTATLVIVGDHIDKGPNSIAVIDVLRVLEAQAAKAGGRSIALMGNHEAELLADPRNSKAMSKGVDEEGICHQLHSAGVDPRAIAAGTDAEGRGQWLANLPLGVRVKKWFFAHGGNTQGLSVAELDTKLQSAIQTKGFGHKDIIGNGSVLEDQQWYGKASDDNAGQKEVEALDGPDHIVFGHDPSAFNARGKPRFSKNRLLVKLDGAMGIHDDRSPNPAFMLHISTVGKDVVTVVDEAGKATELQ